MDNFNAKQFIKDRDEALLSLDKDKIMAYCKKYGVPIPDEELVFWAGIHKAIVHLISATQEQKERSAQWLLEHGFMPFIR